MPQPSADGARSGEPWATSCSTPSASSLPRPWPRTLPLALAQPGTFRGGSERRVAHALDLVGLADRRDASPFELSGGQQRLAAIAGVLAMEPELLVLDEPTAGLDPRGRARLRALMADLAAHGVTLLQVTHSMEDAARADHVVVLDQSHVLATGTPAEVFCPANEPQLTAVGLGLPRPLAYAREHALDARPLTLVGNSCRRVEGAGRRGGEKPWPLGSTWASTLTHPPPSTRWTPVSSSAARSPAWWDSSAPPPPLSCCWAPPSRWPWLPPAASPWGAWLPA